MEYRTIANPDELRPWLPQLLGARALAVRLTVDESGPRAGAVSAVALAAEGLPVLVFERGMLGPEGAALLREPLHGAGVAVFHDAKTDLRHLASLGIGPKAIFSAKLAAQLLFRPGDPVDWDIDSLILRHFPESAPPSQGGHATIAREAGLLLRLREAFIPELVQNGLVRVAAIEFQCARALAHMEYHGIFLDTLKWAALSRAAEAERDRALEKLYTFTGRPAAQATLWGGEASFGPNFDSNAFALKLLRDHGIPAASTSRRDLAPFRDVPLVTTLAAYRKASKAISSFLKPYPALVHPETGRLHPQYEQITAYSGRMSCSNPNIQQIPRDREFRECFTAPPGRNLIIADYSQIELRVAAQISGDERMLAAYRKGEDLHLLTASYIANKPMELVSKQERQAYKAVNLGLIYGMGAAGLRETAKLSYGVDMSAEDAALFRDRFFATYRGISRWHRNVKADTSGEGRTLTGRRFPYRVDAGLPERSNLPVQGSAADIIKKALGLLADRLEGSDTRIIAVVHDEVLLECAEEITDEAVAALAGAMEDAANEIMPDVPTTVSPVVSASWAEK